MSNTDFDAIVIGGGHAGIEASLALARLGFETMLITQSLDTIGRLSCNPSIGGLSKGNIVREIDALGGEMAQLIDKSMIQFRILNQRRGPAVQAPRAQADKFLYNRLAKETVEGQKHLQPFQDTVTDFILDHDSRNIKGVVTERGRRFTARTVVMTTGTFMEGKIFIGDYESPSGRIGEPAAIGLGSSLRRLGFRVARLKTGTPARVSSASIDYSRMEEQPGDPDIIPFSFANETVDRPQVPCWITYTNEKTHDIIRANMDKSPLYGGKIVGTGPRYCPSIEDKVVRFPDRDRHQIFVEPEGLGSDEMYLNGISSSLPETVQESFIRTLPGLEDVKIMRPGYAVEYDFIDPRQLLPSLMTKQISGLFSAGQTNGTSGYEEAGCQGLLAGINAAMYMLGRDPLILSRSEAYSGVLVDDLVTLGTKEPYRMFTSRAEYRLCLRHDTADIRLSEKAAYAGLRTPVAAEALAMKVKGLDEIKDLLASRRVGKKELEAAVGRVDGIEQRLGESFEKLMKVPGFSAADLLVLDPELENRNRRWLEQAAIDIKYEGYIGRQEKQIRRFKRMENLKIPVDFNYDTISGISVEAIEKFKDIKPLSVGQASRISGVRSSDIAVLLVALGRGAGVSEDDE
ncbi:MAG: tRNA uridine-5-carboxymethylaminomethyl(34) synthesis enzyme MnmG [Spirochaetales bacterium]|uniref:tRNA uridine 5-carboxymethylaminomethyl modification enzyme MnmG n=1 Tax=Candidatus Thalassospirochaeta sargassi TaxID=3119039 RepID=A0AAJ1IFI9_9SPIO|nr:tRNA uridine-5-carboxymethylaminomethyl(34) synthesis enzyme MnmG [Spirochaetales bacterium]